MTLGYSAPSIFRNFSFLTVGRVLADAITFILFVVLSRVYGQQGIGQYSFAVAIGGFLVVSADFGLYNLSIKDLSRSSDSISEYYSNVIVARIGLSIVAILLLLSAVYVLPLSRESALIVLVIGIYQIIYTFTDGFSAVFVAREQMLISSTIELSLRLLIAVFSIVLALSGAPILLALFVFPVAALIHLIVVTRMAISFIGLRWSGTERPQLVSLIRTAVPYAFFTLLRQITTRVDVLLLGILIGTVASGVYNVAYRVIFLLLFIPYYCGLAIFPIISRMYSSNAIELAAFYNGAFRLIVLLAIPMTVGLFLASSKIVILLFDAQFSESIIILQFLCVLVGLAFFKNIAGTFMTSCDLQAARTKLQWIAASLNLIGNVILIPVLGVIGAAISTIISELVLTILSIITLKQLFGVPKVASRALIAISGTFVFTVFWLFFSTMHILILVPAAITIYVLVLMTFKSIRSKELILVKSIISGGSN